MPYYRLSSARPIVVQLGDLLPDRRRPASLPSTDELLIRLTAAADRTGLPRPTSLSADDCLPLLELVRRRWGPLATVSTHAAQEGWTAAFCLGDSEIVRFDGAPSFEVALALLVIWLWSADWTPSQATLAYLLRECASADVMSGRGDASDFMALVREAGKAASVSDAFAAWLGLPSAALGGQPPIKVFRDRGVRTIYRAVQPIRAQRHLVTDVVREALMARGAATLGTGHFRAATTAVDRATCIVAVWPRRQRVTLVRGDLLPVHVPVGQLRTLTGESDVRALRPAEQGMALTTGTRHRWTEAIRLLRYLGDAVQVGRARRAAAVR